MAIICRRIGIFFIGLFLLGSSFVSPVAAATITQISYSESGRTVGTFVAASTTNFSTFTPITAITAASTITVTFPEGTTLTSGNIAASDFRIVQAASIPDLCANAGADTAPSGVSVNVTNRTITFTVASGSLSTTAVLVACGKGQVTIKTSSSAGGNEIQNPTTSTTTGSFAIATSVGDSGSINNVTFNPDTAATMAFTTEPSSTATAGQDFGTQPVVTAYDQYGNVVTNNNSTQITIAAVLASDGTTAGNGTLSANSNPVTLSSGVATFAGVDYTKAESIKLKATASGISQVLSNTIAVSAASANKLVVQTQPSSTATAGQDFGTQPIFLVQDQFSNTVTSDNTTAVSLSAVLASDGITAGGGTLSASANPATAVSGVVTFSGVDYTKAESIKLKATSLGLTQALSNSVTVDPASASQLAFTTQPSSTATAGQDFGTQPIVTVRDAFHNTVTGSSASITLSTVLASDGTTTGNGTLSASSNPLSATAGVATFASVDYTKAEAIKLRATSPGLSQALSDTVTVSAGSATTLTKSSGDNQSALIGQALESSFIVGVTDAFGNAVSGTTVNFTVTTAPNGASGYSLSHSSGASDSNGQISSSLTLGNVEGAYQVTAASSGLTSIVFSATAVGYPTISAINPSTKGRNVFNQTFTLTGTNFRSGATVAVSSEGVTVHSYTVNSETQISLVLSISNTASLGGHSFTVTNQDSSSISTDNVLTVTGQPVISGISPNRLERNEVADIVITGSNFNESSVNFGGSVRINTITLLSSSQIKVNLTVQNDADHGNRSVIVTNSDGGVSEAGTLTVASALNFGNVVAVPEPDGTVTISWTTSLPTTSELQYGLSTYSRVVRNNSPATSHRITLGQLSQGWVYHFRVKSRDAYGQTVETDDAVFTPNILVTENISLPRFSFPVTTTSKEETPLEPVAENTYQPRVFKSLTLTLRGVNGQPLINQRVELHSTPQIAYTNGRGEVTFPNVEPGEHELIVQQNGVEFRQKIHVVANQEAGKTDEAAPIEVTLQPLPAQQQRLFWIIGGIGLLSGIALGLGLRWRILK